MLRHALGIILMALFACTRRENPTDTLEEQERAAQIGNADIRVQVRQAARSHILKNHKDCQIHGFSIYASTDADYSVGVDCAVGADRQTIHLSVELFAGDTGQLYWKTEYLAPRPDSRPFEFAMEPYRPVKKR